MCKKPGSSLRHVKWQQDLRHLGHAVRTLDIGIHDKFLVPGFAVIVVVIISFMSFCIVVAVQGIWNESIVERKNDGRGGIGQNIHS